MRLSLLTVVTLGWLVFSTSEHSAAVAEEGWSQFRGPDGMGSSQARDLPLKWDPSTNLSWKTALPGPGASSPIVWKDRIYITCYSGYFVPGEPGGSQEELRRHLLALRGTDGTVLWDRAIPARLPEEESIRDHGFAASTPAADEERVYVFFGKSGVMAFDHGGNEKWRKDVGSKTHGWGSAASPVLYEDLVIVNASVESDSLVALDRRTGEERWKVRNIKESWNTPVLVKPKSGKVQLVLATRGKVQSLDPETGKSLWNCDTDIGWYMVPSIVSNGDLVCCLGGRSGTAALAVRLGGSGDVTQSHRLWTSMKGSNVSSPVISGSLLFWVHEQRGTAYCADADTGEILYEQRLDRAGQVYSSALLGAGRVYYLTRDGKTYVLAARPEFELLATNDLRDGSLFNGSPVVMGNKLLIRSDKFLYCVGE